MTLAAVPDPGQQRSDCEFGCFKHECIVTCVAAYILKPRMLFGTFRRHAADGSQCFRPHRSTLNRDATTDSLQHAMMGLGKLYGHTSGMEEKDFSQLGMYNLWNWSIHPRVGFGASQWMTG